MRRAARARIETPRASFAGCLFKSSGGQASVSETPSPSAVAARSGLRGTPDAAAAARARVRGPRPTCVWAGGRRHAVPPAVRAPLTLWVHARPRAPPLLFSGRGVPRGHRRTHRAAGCREAETCLWGPWGPTWTCQGSSWWLAKGVRGGTAMVSLCDWDIGLAGNGASSPPAQRSPVFIEVPSFLAVYSRIVVCATTREPKPGRAVPSISYAVLADQVGSEPVPVGR